MQRIVQNQQIQETTESVETFQRNTITQESVIAFQKEFILLSCRKVESWDDLSVERKLSNFSVESTYRRAIQARDASETKSKNVQLRKRKIERHRKEDFNL